MTIKKDTEVQIGQPSKYPTELVNALSDLFREQQSVKAAYLAAIKMDKTEKLPHLMIAIDVEGNMYSVSGKAGKFIAFYCPTCHILNVGKH